MPKAKSKHYQFDTDEFLYVSEHRGEMEWHDSLIRRYIAAKVLKRLGINVKSKIIRVSKDGAGIDVDDAPNAPANPAAPTQPESPASPASAPESKPEQ